MRAIGIDPGFANMGIAVLDWRPESKPLVVSAYVISTAKASNSKGRVSHDDVRRMQILWMAIEQAIVEYAPVVVGVETYTVYKPTQGGKAGKGTGWKAGWAYALTVGVCSAHSIEVVPYMPADLKRRIGGDVGASKLDIEIALAERVCGLGEALSQTPPNKCEHAADAIGHGLLALADYVKAKAGTLSAK